MEGASLALVARTSAQVSPTFPGRVDRHGLPAHAPPTRPGSRPRAAEPEPGCAEERADAEATRRTRTADRLAEPPHARDAGGGRAQRRRGARLVRAGPRSGPYAPRPRD